MRSKVTQRRKIFDPSSISMTYILIKKSWESYTFLSRQKAEVKEKKGNSAAKYVKTCSFQEVVEAKGKVMLKTSAGVFLTLFLEKKNLI